MTGDGRLRVAHGRDSFCGVREVARSRGEGHSIPLSLPPSYSSLGGRSDSAAVAELVLCTVWAIKRDERGIARLEILVSVGAPTFPAGPARAAAFLASHLAVGVLSL